MKPRLKLLSMLALCSLAVVALRSSAATIYTLVPGGFVNAQSSGYPVGGSTVATVTYNYSSSTLLGTLTSKVISGDTSNPYGGLTFLYLVTVDGASPQVASRLTVSSFGGFATDVSYDTTISQTTVGTIVNPTSFGRSADGQVLRFSFDNPNIGDAQGSALMVVQTDARFYGNGTTAVIDGSSANVSSLVPVPEPATGALLLLATAAFALRRKH